MTDRGAHFYRCDFQVHTPRDLNWAGDRPKAEDERAAYATEFVAKCRSVNLQAVAITDHHDVAYFRWIKQAALAETNSAGQPLPSGEQLIVFPGMELTLVLPCQALLIFDAEFPVEFLGQALPALGLVAAPDADERHAPVQKIQQSLNDIYASLSKLDTFRGRFTIFPHVSDGGHKTLLRQGFEHHYKSMPCVGGYVDGNLPTDGKKSAGMRSITNGTDKNYGNKALGLFQTSDNRSRTFDKLGQHATWVKWARPTAEALRQACLARHSRIVQDAPKLPAIMIERVDVSNSKFLGPFVVDLNPQYNAFIGGRGTGKSSILEYLRWGLCDQPISDGDDDAQDFQSRRAALIEKTLAALGGSVQVSLLVNGTTHVVRRYVDGRVLLKVGNSDLVASTETEIRTLLPIQAYSQKQLSSVGIKSEELRRFVTLPIQIELEAVGSRIAGVASELRTAHDALREHRRLTKETTSTRTEITSIDQQLRALREGLTGVSDEDRATMAEQPRWSESERIVGTWRREMAEVVAELRRAADLVGRVPSPIGDAKVHDVAAMAEMEQAVLGVTREVSAALSAALQAATSEGVALGGLKSLASKWDAAAAFNRTRYTEAKARAASSEEVLKQIEQLEKRHSQLTQVLTRGEKRLADLNAPDVVLRTLRAQWVDAHAQRAGLLEAQCSSLGRLSRDLLRASVRRGAGTEHLAAQLRDLVKGSKMRTDRWEGLLAAVASDAEPVGAWLDIVDELRALSEMDSAASSPLPSTPRLASAGVHDADRRKLAERLIARGWSDLLVAEIVDVPTFEYRSREGEYIAFSDASAGQQATALMFVLLNQDGPPLVIDQPEDDLDNHIVSDVVREVWSAKTRRQIIFASHNANLVVNGDAELVVCCDYRTKGDQSGGMIKVQGAIDVDDVREEIASVMEGGRDAFTLRREKYGF